MALNLRKGGRFNLAKEAPQPQVQQQQVVQQPSPSFSEQIAPTVSKVKKFISTNKKKLIGTIALLIIGYGVYFFFFKSHLTFEGTWIDKKTESRIMIIQKSGSDYFVTLNNDKLSAKLSDNQLIVDNERIIALDKNTGTLVFLGEDYITMDGTQFIGKWASNERSELMDISKDGSDFKVVFKTYASVYDPQTIPCKLKDGVLIGDYYGEKQNFILKVASSKLISLTIDPFAEFEPTRNEILSPTNSTFVVTNGDAFVGNWSLDSKSESPIFVISKENNNYKVAVFGDYITPAGNWNTTFSNSSLNGTNKSKISFSDEEHLIIENYYMQGATEQKLYKLNTLSNYFGVWKASASDKEYIKIFMAPSSFTKCDNGSSSYKLFLAKFRPNDSPYDWQDLCGTNDLISNKSVSIKHISDGKIEVNWSDEGINNKTYDRVSQFSSEESSSNNIQSSSSVSNQEQNTQQQTISNGSFYVISVAAVKTESQAKTKAAELKSSGNPSGYLWIPDYASLSGAQFYSVYIGPYSTQHDCEVATEAYRKNHPDAYGVLVSQDRKRVQINGIGKVTVTQK